MTLLKKYINKTYKRGKCSGEIVQEQCNKDDVESNGDVVSDMGFDSSLRRDARFSSSFSFHLFLAPSFFQGTTMLACFLFLFNI